MQVFIVGSPIETAMALDKKRLNKQIIETRQIIDAICGKKAWANHPCTIQYKEYKDWLFYYLMTIENYYWYAYKKDVPNPNDFLKHANAWNDRAITSTPKFHTKEYFNQMKRRLFEKDDEHYKQWSHLGKSDINWYWSPSEGKFIKYINGKKI